jgi:phosphatidylserine synthase
MWFAHNGAGTAPDGRTLMALVVTISMLEVSSVPYHTNKALKMSPRTTAFLIVFAAACLTFGAMYDISSVLVVIGLAHVVSGPLMLAWTWPRRRKKRKAAEEREQANDDAAGGA